MAIPALPAPWNPVRLLPNTKTSLGPNFVINSIICVAAGSVLITDTGDLGLEVVPPREPVRSARLEDFVTDVVVEHASIQEFLVPIENPSGRCN